MNIIIISMEASGASGFTPLISQMYQYFYGKRIYWNGEISRVIASDNDYVFPEGFSIVYYVDPKRVLERPFDKVILLHRDLDEIKKDIYDRLKIEEDAIMNKKLQFYYDLMYNQDIEDEKLFRVDLKELRHYPVAVLSDMFDFLGFPKMLRPLIYPFPIFHSELEAYDPSLPLYHRNWKKYSSILRKGHQEENTEKDEYTQMVNVECMNPYKLTPVEYTYQKGTVYRIRPIPIIDTMEVLGLV